MVHKLGCLGDKNIDGDCDVDMEGRGAQGHYISSGQTGRTSAERERWLPELLLAEIGPEDDDAEQCGNNSLAGDDENVEMAYLGDITNIDGRTVVCAEQAR